jgi:hypothetical protein
MDERACRESLWLAIYTAQLCVWPDVADEILNVLNTVDRYCRGRSAQ